jgi:hypothetical protein
MEVGFICFDEFFFDCESMVNRVMYVTDKKNIKENECVAGILVEIGE